MVKITLMGGLGNQMFQYAAAKSLAMISGQKLKLDLGFLEQKFLPIDGFTPRKYELDVFHLEEKRLKNSNEILKKVLLFINRLNYKICSKKWVYFNESSLEFDSTFFSLTPPVHLNGFFQSEKYFINIKPHLLEIFRFPKIYSKEINIILHEILNTKSVSIHVRRGDYVSSIKTNNYHGTCDKVYYIDAIKMINNSIGQCKYFFFSDDINWVKDNFDNVAENIFVDSGKYPSWYDMFLMSQCKHNIIANSSYSWWGAWLNQNPNKVVIAPKTWFLDSFAQESSKNIIPETWIRI